MVDAATAIGPLAGLQAAEMSSKVRVRGSRAASSGGEGGASIESTRSQAALPARRSARQSLTSRFSSPRVSRRRAPSPAPSGSSSASPLTAPPCAVKSSGAADTSPPPGRQSRSATSPDAAPTATTASPLPAGAAASATASAAPHPSGEGGPGGAASPPEGASHSIALPLRIAATSGGTPGDPPCGQSTMRSSAPGEAPSTLAERSRSDCTADPPARTCHTSAWPSLATAARRHSSPPPPVMLRSTASRVCPRSRPSASVCRSITRITPDGMA
mmetsp:Transcript_17953/g.57411  ORF Transcript_17953/g.57411 Transcript_17953/m.57411 type:complete len:273 (-) Transcript_17953:146-964(-)